MKRLIHIFMNYLTVTEFHIMYFLIIKIEVLAMFVAQNVVDL